MFTDCSLAWSISTSHINAQKTTRLAPSIKLKLKRKLCLKVYELFPSTDCYTISHNNVILRRFSWKKQHFTASVFFLAWSIIACPRLH